MLPSLIYVFAIMLLLQVCEAKEQACNPRLDFSNCKVKGNQLNCSSLNWNNIPCASKIPKVVEEIDFGNNKIKKLNFEMLNGYKLVGLGKLVFDHNKITMIDNNAFSGVKGLKLLYINYNQIQFIGFAAFYGLYKLDYLSLCMNSKAFTISSHAFDGISSHVFVGCGVNTFAKCDVNACKDQCGQGAACYVGSTLMKGSDFTCKSECATNNEKQGTCDEFKTYNCDVGWTGSACLTPTCSIDMNFNACDLHVTSALACSSLQWTNIPCAFKMPSLVDRIDFQYNRITILTHEMMNGYKMIGEGKLLAFLLRLLLLFIVAVFFLSLFMYLLSCRCFSFLFMSFLSFFLSSILVLSLYFLDVFHFHLFTSFILLLMSLFFIFICSCL